MIKVKRIILFTLFIANLGVASPELQKKHEQLFKDVKHLSVDFEQTVYKKLRDRKLERSGNAYFSQPNSFRWNFSSKKLGDEEFYYNGKKLTHFRASEKTVTNYNTNIGLAKELNEVVQLVLSPQNLYDRYEVTDTKSKGAQTEIALKPKPGNTTDIKTIGIVINDKQKFVETVKITYMDNNYTKFKFANPKFSTNKPDLFRFTRKGKFTVREHG